MRHSILLTALPLFLALDLLLPFLLAPACPGYRHTMQVMSVLGSERAPLHLVYNLWLIVLGVVVLAAGFFTLFILADKPAFQGTAVAREGLWQRLSLLCMYLPVGALSLFYP